VEDVKIRITSVLDQLLMKWIVTEGKDMFNLQANAFEIAKGIREDLDSQMVESGLTITGFQIMSFSYPKEVQDMINKNASHGMVGNIDKYQQISMIDSMASGKNSGGGTASDMAGMMMGMNMANQMMEKMNKQNQNQEQTPNQQPAPEVAQNQEKKRPNFCPNCGAKTGEGNFCSNCGHKLV